MRIAGGYSGSPAVKFLFLWTWPPEKWNDILLQSLIAPRDGRPLFWSRKTIREILSSSATGLSTASIPAGRIIKPTSNFPRKRHGGKPPSCSNRLRWTAATGSGSAPRDTACTIIIWAQTVLASFRRFHGGKLYRKRLMILEFRQDPIRRNCRNSKI